MTKQQAFRPVFDRYVERAQQEALAQREADKYARVSVPSFDFDADELAKLSELFDATEADVEQLTQEYWRQTYPRGQSRDVDAWVEMQRVERALARFAVLPQVEAYAAQMETRRRREMCPACGDYSGGGLCLPCSSTAEAIVVEADQERREKVRTYLLAAQKGGKDRRYAGRKLAGLDLTIEAGR